MAAHRGRDRRMTPGSHTVPWLRRAVAAMATVMVALLAWSVALRVGSPFGLEQLETYMAASIAHAAGGAPFFRPPDTTFIPYMYPPLYDWTSAAWMHLTGVNALLAGREVSIASTAGALCAIALLVWRETRSAWAAWLAAGLYAGCYALCFAWFDLARLDSFYVLLTLLALYCTRWLPSPLAAAAWVLVAMCKQPMMPVAALMLLCAAWPDRRRVFAGLATFAVLLGAWTVAMAHASGGWYAFYVFRVPRANAAMSVRALLLIPFLNLVAPFGLTLLLWLVCLWLRGGRPLSTALRFWLWSGSILLITWYQSGHGGSTVNVLMPAYALVAIGAAMATWMCLRSGVRGVPELALAAMLLQLLSLMYNPGAWKPTPGTQAAAAALHAVLAATPGDVYIPDDTYAAQRADKPPHPDMTSLADALHALPPAAAATLRAQMRRYLCVQTAAMVLDAHGQVTTLAQLLDAGPALPAHFTQPALLPGTEAAPRSLYVVHAIGGQDAAACQAAVSPSP